MPPRRAGTADGPIHSRACADRMAALGSWTVLLGALLGAKAQFERTPLHDAAASGDANAIKSLVEAGASLEAQSGGKWTPLFLAVEEGHTEAAKVLVEAGASLEAQDDGKWRPLHVAAHQGHTGAIKALVEAGASLEAQGEGRYVCRCTVPREVIISSKCWWRLGGGGCGARGGGQR